MLLAGVDTAECWWVSYFSGLLSDDYDNINDSIRPSPFRYGLMREQIA